MHLAFVATPPYTVGQTTPGFIDGEAIAARLSQSDLALQLIRLDPQADLAEQIEAALEAPGLGPIASILVYAACPVVVDAEGELFLCFDPADPATGDAFSDIALTVRERFAGALAFILECRHAAAAEGTFPSAGVVSAAKRVIHAVSTGANLLAAARPHDDATEASVSPLTRELIDALDGADPMAGLTLREFHAALDDSEALLGAVPAYVCISGDPPFELIERRATGGLDATDANEIEVEEEIDVEAEAPGLDADEDDAAVEVEVATELETEQRAPAAASPETEPVTLDSSAASAQAAMASLPVGPASRPARTSARATSSDHVVAADARRDDGDLDGALSELKKALVLVGASDVRERAGIYARIGEINRRQERLREAISNFEKSLQLVPTNAQAEAALLELSVQARDWRSVQAAEERMLAALDDRSERVDRLVEFGTRWLELAGDTARARACLERARALAPEDLRVLGKLRAIYETTRSGQEALAVRREIARLTPDASDRARQYFELGEHHRIELSREDLALELYDLALDSDPTQLVPLEIVARLLAERQEWSELERAYRAMLTRCAAMPSSPVQREVTWELYRRLGLLFRDHLEDPVFAIDAFEAALRVKPEDLAGRLVVVDLARLLHDLERAVLHLREAARFEPARGATYHELFQAFQRLGRPDEAYTTASVTAYLGESEQRERFIFEEHVPHGVPTFAQPIPANAWSLFMPEHDENVEGILAAVASAAIAARIAELDAAGRLAELDPAHRQDLKTSTVSAVRSLAWASQLLGVPAPYVHLREDSPVTIASTMAREPAVIVGAGALRGRTLPELAFLVGRHLAFSRGASRLLLHYPTIESLSACFLAAVKIALPETPLPAVLREAAEALIPAIEPRLGLRARHELVQAVRRFDDANARADLGAWVGAIERSVTRVGYVLAGDLRVAATLVREDASGVLSPDDKIADLLGFAVSEAHHQIRVALGVAIEP
jgi:tetratricopeptide (TPR) repeat protein